MKSRGPEDSSQAYFFEGFISFFEDFSLTNVSISPSHSAHHAHADLSRITTELWEIPFHRRMAQ